MRQFGGCVPGQKLKTKLIENTLTLQLPANSWLPDWSVEYPTPAQVKYICLVILYIERIICVCYLIQEANEI